ncbi:unnamed protein product [Phaeothamnion confervicola]
MTSGHDLTTCFKKASVALEDTRSHFRRSAFRMRDEELQLLSTPGDYFLALKSMKEAWWFPSVWPRHLLWSVCHLQRTATSALCFIFSYQDRSLLSRMTRLAETTFRSRFPRPNDFCKLPSFAGVYGLAAADSNRAAQFWELADGVTYRFPLVRTPAR